MTPVTPATTRALRRGLLGLVVVVLGAVAWTIRKPTPPPASVSVPEMKGGTGTTVGEIVVRRIKGEAEWLVLRAKKMVGQEGEDSRFEGVNVEIAYMARGKPGRARIVADACRLTGQDRAVFQGRVHVATEDGFEMWTETLLYNANKGGIVRTADPATFARKDVSGSATGFEYRAESGQLDLLADVRMRIVDEKGPPTDISAQTAELVREERVLRFTGEVRVDQGSDRLEAGRLRIDLNEELTAASRAVASEKVEVRTSGAQPLPGATGVSKAKGPRVLKADKLDLWFREDRSIKEATASPDADLLLSPGPGEAPETRRITSRVLAFQFDEQGRLVELLGQRDVVVSAEPLRRGAGSPRTVRAPAMVARFDPESGDMRRIEFDRGAEFQEGSRVGRGGAAVFEGERRILVLQDDPELSDAEEGTKLDAGTIEILSATGDVHARGGVQQTRKGKAEAGTPQAVLGGGQAGSMIKAERLAYVAKTRTATYEGKAFLRAGKDEVSADTLVLEEPGTGKRRLQARGEVKSLMYPRPRRGAPKEPAPVEGRAAEMVYDESSREIVYAGGAVLKQGEIVTRSPKATLTLNREGTEVERLEAGEPVELEQGPRRATGRRATYTPGNETVVIEGDNATLKDPGQQVVGRVLTLHLGDGTILVDGQELVRTQVIIVREPRSP